MSGRTFRGVSGESVKMRRKVFKRSPCGLPPATVTGLIGRFDTAGRHRHLRIRAKIRWDEVAEDTAGFPVQMLHYDVEWNWTGQQEVQRVDLTGFNSSSGSDWFQLAYNGKMSDTIGPGGDVAYTRNAIEDAIADIQGIVGAVEVSDLDDTGFTVTFQEERGYAQLTCPFDSGCTVAIDTVTQGHSATDGTFWNRHPQRLKVSAKDDTDDNDKAHLVIKGVHRKHRYRFRVRAVSRDCHGAWSSWEVIGRPRGGKPNAPINVRGRAD